MTTLLILFTAYCQPAVAGPVTLTAPERVAISAVFAQPGTNPFAPKPKPPAETPAEPKPAEQKPADQNTPQEPAAQPGNPFAPKPAAPGSTNPFAPKPPAATTPKPAAPKPAEPQPDAAPRAPAELVVGGTWNVQPDPALTPVAATAGAPIAAPGPAASTDLRREKIRHRVVTSDVPSPIVGIGLNEKDGDLRDIWNLATAQKLGTIKGLALEGSALMSVSPDGAMFAAKPQFDDFVVLVNVSTGKTQKSIPLGGMRPELLAFSAANRLIVADDGRVVVHSLPDGRREREIKIDRWLVRDGWTLSPGGKYLAVLHREAADRNLVSFYDLSSGELAGTCRLTGDPADSLGIAISRDGKRLASIVDEGDGVRVIQCELAGPKRIPDFKVTASDVFGDDGYQGPVVEWLPDGKHLLVAGRLAIDTAISELARTLPPPSPWPLASVGPGVTYTFNGRELAPVPLNLSIDAPGIPDSVSPVLPAVPLIGPPVAAGDRSSSVQKTLAPPSRWEVKLAAPPTIPEKLDTNGFRIPGGFVHQVLLSAGTPAVAAVSYAAAPLGQNVSDETASWVEIVDLLTGNGKSRVDFTFPTVAVALSPTARTIATLSQDGSGRVDIWSLEDDQHQGGCQPAGQRPDRQVPWFVEYIDATHLLIAVADELSLWEVPAWKQVYTMQIGSIRPAVSPARDYFLAALPSGNQVAVVESISGTVKGAISTSNLPGDRPLAAAFHHRGRFAAVLSGGAGSGELAVVDTGSGREVSRIRIPVAGEVLQFCDDEHVLIDGASLVSLPKERVVWTYQLATGMHLRDCLGGYHWYVTAVNPTDKSYIVYGASLPEDFVKRQIQSSTKSGGIVMHPTDPIRVEVQTSDLTGPHIIKHIKETLAGKYAAASVPVSEDAQFALVVDPGRMGVQRTSVWKVSIVQAGQTVWSCWIQGTPEGALLLPTEPPGTDTRFADPPEVRAALAGLLQFEPPKFAFARGAALGDGTSMLTTSGPRQPR